MGTVLLNLVIAFFLSLPTQSYANEILSSGNTVSTPTPSLSNALSSLPARENFNLCKDDELRARENLQNTCLTKFGNLGITEALDPSEIVETKSCPSIESPAEYAAGCWSFFKELPAEALGTLKLLFGIGKYSQLIQQTCGSQPTPPLGASRRGARHGNISANEAILLAEHQLLKNQYNSCSERVIDQAQANIAADRVLMSQIRTKCTALTPPQLRNRTRGAAYNRRLQWMDSCLLEEAGKAGCDSCVASLTNLPIPNAMLKTIRDELLKYPAFNCYNKKTQGKMACAAISLAAGVPLAGAGFTKIAAKLPAAFQKARGSATQLIANMRNSNAPQNQRRAAVSTLNATSRRNNGTRRFVTEESAGVYGETYVEEEEDTEVNTGG